MSQKLPKIFIGIPSHDAQMLCETSRALQQALFDCADIGLERPLLYYVTMESILPHARNTIVCEFLKSDCTDLLFIDADMCWNREAFLQLFSYPVDVVGASYRRKIGPVEYAVRWLNTGDEVQTSDPKTGLLEVEGIPMGLCRITRAALMLMIDKLGLQQYADDRPLYPFFSNEFGAGYMSGEDYFFCRRFREAGGKVWVDPNIAIDHYGIAPYRGHLGMWLLEKMAAHEKEAA